MKCDQEPAILVLRNPVYDQSGIKILEEELPVKDSRSNGVVDIIIRNGQGRIRTLRDALEARYKRKITREHPSLTWLVGHAPQCINGYLRGKDCKTACEISKRSPFNVGVAKSGEYVWYKKTGFQRKRQVGHGVGRRCVIVDTTFQRSVHSWDKQGRHTSQRLEGNGYSRAEMGLGCV